MVDSKAKGARGENAAKKILIEHTGLNWQRTPMSGALDERHGLKGDLYLPDCKQRFCVEVKHYKDDHISTKILTGKNPQLFIWWEQTLREAAQVKREPLLVFKHDRSKFFVGTTIQPSTKTDYIHVDVTGNSIYILLLEAWLKNESPKFILDNNS